MAVASLAVLAGMIGGMASIQDGRMADAVGWMLLNLLGVVLWVVLAWMAGAFSKQAEVKRDG